MEVKIGFNYKQHGGLLKLKYREGTVKTVAQLNKILESNAALDVAWKKKHMDKLTMVGVRTPVQGFPQMEYAMVKEFLPESAGGIMILPAQIVVKSGGDFDIDKLTFYTTSYDERGETYNKTFDVKDYEAKLEQQKELKRTKQELKVLRELVEKEIASNEIFLQRQSLKDEITQIQQEIKDAVEAVSDFIDTGYITKEDSSWAAEAASDKEDLERAFANLATFDANNDVRVLQTIATIKSNLRRINSQVDEIQVYKKSLTNELVNTLKSVLKQGELYDSLVTPNTNSVLTQYTQPGIKISTTDVFNPLTSWRIYLENILSKDALGIDAKINTLQKEFQRAGLKFINPLLNRYYFEANKDELDNIMLGGKKDARGENRISKVLSEFINGHVDIAKEDWIILLGLDQETSPLAHAMIIAGTPIENVLGFINSPIIKTLLEIGNRPEIHKKLSNIRPSKKSAILTLTNNRIKGITDPEIAKLVAKAQRRISALEIKSKNLILDIYSDVLLSNPRFSKYITEFNPSESLVGEEAAIRDLAYLLQFSVVLRQQESLRSLTSMSDFNTANYRTSFQSVELMEAESTLKEDFNSSGIDFMFKDSALAQFNVGSLVQDTMEQIYPLSDSLEVRNNISLYLSRMNVYGQEDRIKAIERYKNTLLVPYMLLTASSESKGNLLEYYRGSNGIYLRTTKNNIEERFAELLQDPDLVNNFLIRNIYIDQEGDGREVEFKLKNTDIDENSKSYRDAFLEGLNSAKPNVKSFFEDLAMGSFLQYAGVFTPGHVVNIIPHEAYVDYTEDAYTKLNDMRQQNPKLFDAYLTLVRFSAKMNAETQGPIKGLASFFVGNFTEQSKRIATLTPTVVKTLSSIESSITGVPSITTPLQAPQPTTQVQGINISTKSSDKLGRELTNPNWGANYIMDIEAEYKANASKIKAPQLSMEEALRFDMNLMYKLQMKKFANHPELVQEITNRGGVKFLEASEHTVGVKGSRWEGKGTDSNFIKVLIRSYQDSLKTTQPAAKFTGDMTYSYGNEKRPGVIADTTFDAILSGERTATTRFEKDGNLDYWKNAKIGDIITWRAKDGRTVDVVVTKALHPLIGSGKTSEIWSKLEGWSIGHFNTKVRPLINQAYQIEFKLIEPTIKPKGTEVKAGIFVNEGAISKEQQLELFNYLKPFLEEQAAKTNKGANASKMIGLGLRWDYKSNNPGKTAVNIPDVINPLNKTKYGYYTESINEQPLGQITNRFREIISRATGLDMSMYDGAIINLYDNNSFISSHNDVDESESAINYPVVGINLGGTGNFSIESRDGNPVQLKLDAGTAYVFGVNGVNREVFHRTFPTAQDSFLPELTTKLDNKTYEAGSYRVTITMRRVMPIEGVIKPGAAIEKEVIDNFEDDVDVADTTPKDTKSSLPPTKSGPASLDLKLDPNQPNDKGNLDDLGFEEDACEI
jgi:alkylated DNA repair dioxygenase AlkB